MKLLTHNFLACNVKGVKNGFPLKLEATQVEIREADMDPGMLQLQRTTASCASCLRSHIDTCTCLASDHVHVLAAGRAQHRLEPTKLRTILPRYN